MASSTLAVGHTNVVSHVEWLAARSAFLTKDPAQKYEQPKSAAGSCCLGESRS
jgi:hypothetical protein